MEDLLTNVRTLLKYFHKSTVAAEALHTIQQSYNSLKKPLGVKLDCMTRWNSTYHMLVRFDRLLPFFQGLAKGVKKVEKKMVSPLEVVRMSMFLFSALFLFQF